MGVVGNVIVLFLVLILSFIYFNENGGAAKYSFQNFTEITKENGYITDEHTVTTVDGYLLTVFRIRRGKNCKTKIHSTPVLLMHGFLHSSDVFIDAGTDAGLAYLLSDACYDVWVGNTRGNYYARKHIKLNPDKDREFWNFSADEISTYDLPAKIDYILEATRSPKINYIGHSQGGSTPLLMCSEIPEYCDKISVIISLAPATRLINSKSILFCGIMEIVRILESVLYNFGVYEMFPRNGLIQANYEYICDGDMNTIRRFICQGIGNAIDSSNPGSIADDTLRMLNKHSPAGSSVRSMARYGQVQKTGIIQKYDYGKTINIEKYGIAEPPVYNLKDIKTPVVILHGKNDYLTSVKDSEWVQNELPNSELFIVEDPLWNHLDMVYSQHINKTIFRKIDECLLKYGS